MRKLIISLLIVLSFTTAAHADNRNQWVVPLISGIIIGNMMNNHPRYYQPAPRYYVPPQPVYRPVYTPVIVCEWVPVYNRWGYYAGQQKQCWEEYQ